MAAQPGSLTEPAVERGPAFARWPGVRVLASARFRITLASLLWLMGVLVLGFVLLRQAVNPEGQYAFDFATYHRAAEQVAAGGSPYDPQMFEGPIAAQGTGAQFYKYPPLLAQLLVPLAGLPVGVAAGIWFIGQGLAVFAATWLAARAGGAARNAETFAWSGVATVFFLPIFDTLWKGNVSGFLALAVAIAVAGGIGAGVGSAAATLLKTTPGVLLLPALMAGRRVVYGLFATVPVVVTAFVLAPNAWFDFVRVIPNLLSGDSHFPNNLAPDNLVAYALPQMPLAADITRWLTVALAVVALVLATSLARRRDGWPAALTLAIAASLLLPTATWYHYLAVLLPLGAFAWPRATPRVRVGLAAGAATVTAGLAALPLTVAGACLMTASTLAAVWPRRPAAVAMD